MATVALIRLIGLALISYWGCSRYCRIAECAGDAALVHYSLNVDLTRLTSPVELDFQFRYIPDFTEWVGSELAWRLTDFVGRTSFGQLR